jgi:hypothetical protein
MCHRMGLTNDHSWTDVNREWNDGKSSTSTPSPVGQDMLMYFTRHGQGYHNVAEAEFNNNLLWEEKECTNVAYFDAAITEIGLKQVTPFFLHSHTCFTLRPLL